MRFYAKYLIVGIVSGILCVCSNMIRNDSVNASQIIFYSALGLVDWFPAYMEQATQFFIPFLLFQILFGTYIYRHFCSAGIYFFSRKKNRESWFIREAGKLYLFVFIYICLFLLSGIISTMAVCHVHYDNTALIITVYYLLIYSMFLFAFTLMINIIAIIAGSRIGFIIAASIEILGMGFFLMLGKIITTESDIAGKYIWMLKINPAAHLVFGLHSSKIKSLNKLINLKNINFDLNESVIYFFTLSIIMIFIGIFVVKKREFIINNRETG